MKVKLHFIFGLLASFFVMAPMATPAGSKPVMVHYMPWFQSPYSLGGTNWGAHWTGNGLFSYHANQFFYFNPNVTNQIASWYVPLIGPYDSMDPAVLEYHVLLMKLGGIDGVIVDWYGPDNYYDYLPNNQRTLALFKFIRKAGLKFSLCYEDATIQAEINGGTLNGITVTATNAIAHAQQTFRYVETNFFTDPSFLRLSNAPVLLNFGPQYFHNSSDWTAMFSVLDPTNQPVFFTEDNRLASGKGAFDWPPMSLSSGSPLTLSSNTLQTYLNSFEQKARNQAWPNFVSSAFPRFHDRYAQIGGTGLGVLDDANGNTLTATLRRALTNNSALVQIVTWNDFGEGTVIEPTVAGNEPTSKYGYDNLGIIQDLRRQYLDANFRYHTNDLSLALRFYVLRKQYGGTPSVTAELDRIFTNLVSGKIDFANQQLTGIESKHPVIYRLSAGDNQLQFSIGGYVASGPQVQMSTNLTAWQAVQTFASSTNPFVFSTSTAQSVCSFYRVQ